MRSEESRGQRRAPAEDRALAKASEGVLLWRMRRGVGEARAREKRRGRKEMASMIEIGTRGVKLRGRREKRELNTRIRAS